MSDRAREAKMRGDMQVRAAQESTAFEVAIVNAVLAIEARLEELIAVIREK